ncbi:uncharacterized protein C8Q71DRAFT_855621 [Rhodofomes roseus]|uniref:Uncharacterized protein n=1 Tax=Rhodofomes roseus TaxID=34475 RepID=A0ABQ8KQX9_9APHY|nr:uncharacterized protein C8Q71DRAFT_855621 [Rhodofomes roseus]KAH9840336.1 hypothetical protein C8Q71DRAFT_855621 [Rhodofomes roseus]
MFDAGSTLRIRDTPTLLIGISAHLTQWSRISWASLGPQKTPQSVVMFHHSTYLDTSVGHDDGRHLVKKELRTRDGKRYTWTLLVLTWDGQDDAVEVSHQHPGGAENWLKYVGDGSKELGRMGE